MNAARRSVAYWRGQMHAVAFYDWKHMCNRKEQALSRTKAALKQARLQSWAWCFQVWCAGIKARRLHAAFLASAISRSA